MNRKAYVLAAVALVIVGVIALAITTRETNKSNPTTISEGKASAKQSLSVCLKKNDQLTIEAPERSNIEQEVVSQLIDVPAGTNVDINITTKDELTATGSSIYPKDYGTFNFSLKKDSTTQTGWRIDTFVACKN